VLKKRTGEAAPATQTPARPARVLKEGPAEAFGVNPRITRDGRARLVHRGAGGVCVEYTLSDEALLDVWRRFGPPGVQEWPPRKPFSPEPDHGRIERAVARALAARQVPAA
jgi:LmbE family N-acetylglucosaminyl deacetylase